MSVWPRLTILLLNGDGGRRRGRLPGSQSARDMAAVYPSNQCLMIGIFSTSVCAVVNSYRYKSREEKHSESQSTFRILSSRISLSLPRPDFAIHKLNSESFLVSNGPTKTPSAACGH